MFRIESSLIEKDALKNAKNNMDKLFGIKVSNYDTYVTRVDFYARDVLYQRHPIN